MKNNKPKKSISIWWVLTIVVIVAIISSLVTVSMTGNVVSISKSSSEVSQCTNVCYNSCASLYPGKANKASLNSCKSSCKTTCNLPYKVYSAYEIDQILANYSFKGELNNNDLDNQEELANLEKEISKRLSYPECKTNSINGSSSTCLVSNSIQQNNRTLGSVTVSCPENKLIVGGCRIQGIVGEVFLSESHPSFDNPLNKWMCSGSSISGGEYSLEAYGYCI